MDRQGGEGKPATQPAPHAHLDTAEDAKEKLNREALPLPQSVAAQLLLRGGEAAKAILAVRL